MKSHEYVCGNNIVGETPKERASGVEVTAPVSWIVEHIDIDMIEEHLVKSAYKLIVKHLVYIIFIATNKKKTISVFLIA